MSNSDVVSQSVAMLTSRNRARECLEQMRRLHRFVLDTPQQQHSESSSELRTLLGRAVFEGKAPRKLLSLMSLLLALLSKGDFSFVRLSTPADVSVLAPLLVHCNAASALQKHVQLLVSWLASDEQSVPSSPASSSGPPSSSLPLSVLQAGFRGLLNLAREERWVLQYAAHVRPVEAVMFKALSKASRMSRQRNTGGFFKIGGAQSAQVPTVELDGRPTEGSFSVLSLAQGYSDDQLLNIQCFCSMRQWLHDMYVRAPSGSTEEVLTRKLDPALRDCVADSCVRVIAQSRLPVTDEASVFGTLRRSPVSKNVVAACQAEAVRILDILCSLEPVLVQRFFPIVQSLVAASQSGVSVEVLEFLVRHGPVVSFRDFDPLFKSLCSNVSLTDGVTALTVLTFFVRNQAACKGALATYFPTLFKLLARFPTSLIDCVLKLLPSFISKTTDVELLHAILDLPAMAAVIEHREESADEYAAGTGGGGGGGGNSGSGAGGGGGNDVESVLSSAGAFLGGAALDPASMMKLGDPNVQAFDRTPAYDPTMAFTAPNGALIGPETAHALFSYLLRSESGHALSLWEIEQTAALINAFSISSCSPVPSVRVRRTMGIVPRLLAAYCDAMIEVAEDDQLEDMVRVMLQRLVHLFPVPWFQDAVRETVQHKLLAVFQECPHFVVSLQSFILKTIPATGLGDVPLVLCFVVGEHAPLSGHESVLRQYHEVVELFTYERLSMLKLDTETASAVAASSVAAAVASPSSSSATLSAPSFVIAGASSSSSLASSSSPHQLFIQSSRFMLVLISCLTKLAGRDRSLVARVILCLYKVLGHEKYLHAAVTAKARLCLRLLKTPALGEVIFKAVNSYPDAEVRYDENSCIEMLAWPATSTVAVSLLSN